MYIQEIYIKIKSKVIHDELVNEFESLMVYYYHNGQIQGLLESTCIEKDKLFALQSTPGKNSLDHSFHNSYVANQKKKIEGLCNSTLAFRIVATPFKSAKDTCACGKTGFYILITDFASTASPVICGNCKGIVPLYQLPKYQDSGYLPILNWQADYISCDNLQIHSKVGERWALNQMENYNSRLSKSGRVICKRIEELTGVPTYYYLHNWEKYKGDSLSRTCPGCNQHWNSRDQADDAYAFKCEHCKLISTTSSNA